MAHMGDGGAVCCAAAGQHAALRLRLDGAGPLGRVSGRHQRIHVAVPWVLWTIAECIGLRSLRPAGPRAAGLLAGLTAIPLLFYGYVGVIGFHVAVVDVLIFQAAVLLAFWVSTALQKRGTLTATVWQAAGVLVLAAVSTAFVVWTASPPELPVFIDPTNGTRGIPS